MPPSPQPVLFAHTADSSSAPTTITTATTAAAAALLPPDDGDCPHHGHYPLHIDLAPRAPLPPVMSVGECEAALDAVQVLVRAMTRQQQHGSGVEGVGVGVDGGMDVDVGMDMNVDVDVLWGLAGLKEALGLDAGWVVWLRGCMGRFVSGLGGVPGVVDGWGGVVGAAGGREDGEMLERALGVCAVFGWAEEARAVMKRAAYVWMVGDDGEGLMKPDGSTVDMAVCGKAAAGKLCLSSFVAMSR